MSDVTHTPGPWRVEDPLGSDAGDHLWIVQEGDTPQVYDWRNLAVVCSDDPDDCEIARPITTAERDANARLIAAAPELLEALSFLADVARSAPNFPSPMALQQADAVIAKAKGAA